MSFVRAVKLRVPAGAAKPGPAIGQALGPLGINMAQFCKDFNEKSSEIYEMNTPLSVILNAMSDRTYTFHIRSPPTSWLLKQAVGMGTGPTSPPPTSSLQRDSQYEISKEAIYHIALIKRSDDNRWHIPLEGIARSVIGTAHSMGIRVQKDNESANAGQGHDDQPEADDADDGEEKEEQQEEV